MPRFDLRQNDGTLDPLAPFKVLAVMCHPNNRIRREKMLGSIQKETGVGRSRRRPLTREAFMMEVRRTDKRAAVAGGLLLTMLQLHDNGHRASLNQAIPLVAALLPKWQQPQSALLVEDLSSRASPPEQSHHAAGLQSISERRAFLGALLHGQQHDRQDIWPGALETLPTFLAYAEAHFGYWLVALPSFAGSPLRNKPLGGVVLYNSRSKSGQLTLVRTAAD